MKTEIKYIGKCLVIESEKERILAIGDLHIGYEEALEKSGIFIGREMFEDMIKEFGGIFGRVGKIDEVVLLGDLKHDFSGLSSQEREELNKLFDFLSERCGRIIVVRGNHDNYLLNVSLKKGVIVKNYYINGGFCFLHGDRDFGEIYDGKIKYWIIGHGHPAVGLSEGAKSEKYKCFLEGNYNGKKVIIVPSFSEYKEGSDPRDFELGLVWKFDLLKFNVMVVGGDLNVLDFGKLGRLK